MTSRTTRFVLEDPIERKSHLLSPLEQNVLQTFRNYLMTPNKMLCFYGPQLEQSKSALDSLIEKDLLIPETFNGAYSLTEAGYAAMNACE